MGAFVTILTEASLQHSTQLLHIHFKLGCSNCCSSWLLLLLCC
jgi:hypothetical protein